MKVKPLLLFVLVAFLVVVSNLIDRWAEDVDGMRSEGVPVSCWHCRE